MVYLLETATTNTPSIWSVPVLGIIGFVVAATLGSVAWYNSKRPAGWENKERPDIVPEVKK